MNLDTPAPNTWCPGCGDFGILSAFKTAVSEMVENKELDPKKLVISAGIGCHAKMVDYLKLNSFYSLHGRVPPALTGIKLANPELTVVGFAGDGDLYGEGMGHLMHTCRRNLNIKQFVHDNQVFALTIGQITPTSPLGFKGRSTPKGSVEYPINPLQLVMAAGATFVARGFAGDVQHLKKIMIAAIKHKGYALIDILQPCVSFNDTYLYLRERVYDLNMQGFDTSNFDAAYKKAAEWGDKIPIGIFYQTEKPTFDELFLKGKNPSKRTEIPSIANILKGEM